MLLNAVASRGGAEGRSAPGDATRRPDTKVKNVILWDQYNL